MKFQGTIHKGKILRPNTIEELRARFLASMKDGTLIIEEIKKFQPHKTNKQLGAWFGLFCGIVLAEFEDRGYDTSFIFRLDKPTGTPISKDSLKDYMYSVCPVYSNGKRITMGHNDMDTAKMAKFFDDCRNIAASQWSIYVPEPDPNWRKTKRTKVSK